MSENTTHINTGLGCEPTSASSSSSCASSSSYVSRSLLDNSWALYLNGPKSQNQKVSGIIDFNSNTFCIMQKLPGNKQNPVISSYLNFTACKWLHCMGSMVWPLVWHMHYWHDSTLHFNSTVYKQCLVCVFNNFYGVYSSFGHVSEVKKIMYHKRPEWWVFVVSTADVYWNIC